MTMQSENFNAVDVEKIITNLQGLGICLKSALSRSPSSATKQYLLFEISKTIELKVATDFYYLQSKIAMLIDIAIQGKLDEEVLKLLDEMKEWIEKIIGYIKRETKD